ncbi:MAG: response regulator [Thermotoga sp.]|nr:response regulator [Thermotogota bacterium]RKX55737.1 MAG: response regulator [Thermotoga sp.]
MAKKILIVEDEDNVRLLYEETLKDEGYDVTAVSYGKDALDMLSKEDFDLVTLDIEMPDMNGLEVAGKIREMGKNVRIVFVTAYSNYRDDLSSWAADDYIVKSSDLNIIKEQIKNLLSERG